MNESRTMSILERVRVILAVTAASYGLPQPGPAPAGKARAARERLLSLQARLRFSCRLQERCGMA